MDFVELIGVFLIALVVAAVFYYGLGRRGPWGAFWVFLLILFLAAWAGNLWIEPAGPVIWGYAWLPMFFWIFMIALIIGIAGGEDRTEIYTVNRTEMTEEELARAEEGAGAAVAFGLFFWLLLSLLVIAIIVGLLT